MKLWLTVFFLLTSSLYSSIDEVHLKVSYYESSEALRVEAVQNQVFIALEQSCLNKGLGKKDYWLKVEVNNKSNKDGNYVLELKNPTLNYVIFFSKNEIIHTGDHLPYSSRDLQSINFAFNLFLEAHTLNIYYINIKTNHAVTVPISLYEKSDFLQLEKQHFQFLYLFLGFMLALIIYNAHLYIFLRDKSYLYYVLFQFFYVGLLLSMSGLGYSSIWIDKIEMNEFILIYFDDFALIFFTLFLLSFLKTKQNFPRLYTLVLFSIVMLIVLSISWGTLHSFLIKPVMLGSIVVMVIIIVRSVYGNILYAKYIFLGMIFLLIGALTTLLKNFGWLEVNFFTTWSIYFSALIEGMFFSLVLAKQIETLKKHKKELMSKQKELLEIEVKKQTLSLTDMVKDKEILLKEVNHRVKNNLQIISSFISFASITEKEGKVLKTLNQRIQAITLLYNSLYKPDSSTTVKMETYIGELCDEIFKIYTPNVQLSLDIFDVEVDFNRAITLGLLVNEIITNMIIHAFQGVECAIIKLSLRKKDEYYTLLIEDNGVGFDSQKNYNGLGLKLIKRLSEKQLKGQLLIESNHKGSSFMITFI